MRRIILTLILIPAFFTLFAQKNSGSIYYIKLTDKENNSFSLDVPEAFLSTRAINRRTQQNIDFDINDLPVTNLYVDSLKAFGLEIILKSKWFNSVTVTTSDSILMDTLTYLSFVASTRKISGNENRNQEKKLEISGLNTSVISSRVADRSNYYNYGYSENQISVHNGQSLHNEGYRGQGMLIAVTDAGFVNVPELSGFQNLFNEERVIKTWNFVHGIEDVYFFHNHGTVVLSVLAANAPGYLIGSAPEAEYILIITEDPYSETFIEELNWISGAEFADSMGADIINVSLGYLKFDDPEFDYYYEDMDGETAKISRAAKIASEKGMIVVAAAGNTGTSQTHPYITAPADAKDIIAVGAIDREHQIAGFSSSGPSYDGRVKPDVVAIGLETIIQNHAGEIAYGYGTSFAAPVISGLIACLWQKFPDKNNTEIMDAVRKSSSKYNNPNNRYGYGIPDFKTAGEILSTIPQKASTFLFDVFPNPFDDNLYLSIPDKFANQKIHISISDVSGRIVYSGIKASSKGNNILNINDLCELKSGFYFLSVETQHYRQSIKLIKN